MLFNFFYFVPPPFRELPAAITCPKLCFQLWWAHARALLQSTPPWPLLFQSIHLRQLSPWLPMQLPFLGTKHKLPLLSRWLLRLHKPSCQILWALGSLWIWTRNFRPLQSPLKWFSKHSPAAASRLITFSNAVLEQASQPLKYLLRLDNEMLWSFIFLDDRIIKILLILLPYFCRFWCF